MNNKPTEKEVMEFMRESNAIEGVYDESSLVDARRAWGFLSTRELLNPYLVMRVHELLMEHQGMSDNDLGWFRTVPVSVGGNSTMNPAGISLAIEEWCGAMNADAAHPGLNWKQLHVDYELIHPFVDGNGRTGRMFMNWYRLKNGLPLLIIHEGEEQTEYYKWFTKT